MSPTLTASPTTTQSSTDLANSFAALTEQMIRQCAGPDEATRLKEHRRAVFTSLCFNLVDCYFPPDGIVTPEMAVVAKVAIMNELDSDVADALPHTELTLRGTAIRNRVLAPYFQLQKEERERDKQLRQQEAHRVREAAAIEARRLKRKTVLVELGVSRASKAAAARMFPHQAMVLLECDVRPGLETLLVGDETDQQADQAIEAAIEGPLLQWEQRLEQARLAKRDRIMDHCFTASLPVLNAALPWMQEVVVKQICETFGLRPPSPAASGASATAEAQEGLSDAPAPRPIRRRRKAAASAHMNPGETVCQNTDSSSTPSEPRRAAR